MQRRTVPSSSRPTAGGPAYSTTSRNTPSAGLGLRREKRKNSSGIAWIIVVILLATIILAIVFPAQFQKAEHEAEVLANKALKVEQDLAQKALRKEQEMIDQWTAHENSNGNTDNQPHNVLADWNDRIAASHEASERMEQQSSRWVDGEKKLKQKLQVLYDRQNQQGQDLGVPVLTRFLGDDFPAYVTSDMDMDAVEEWKKNVEDAYTKMRQEEKAWQKKMQKMIGQRERDIGITTA